MQTIFTYISLFEAFFWEYIGFIIICFTGLYLTIYTKGMQFKALLNVKKHWKEVLEDSHKDNHGIHPIKLVFASTGGMIGVGNIVGIGMAVCIGGLGAIFWIWVGSFCGMLIKYSEIYLGMKYRIKNNRGGYDGGPMYYAKHAFGSNALCYFIAFLLCIYGVEIYQFTILVDRMDHSMAGMVDKSVIVALLLIAVIYSSIGGIRRLANICSIMMPAFMLVYLIIGLYIILSHYAILPGILSEIFHSAFNGQAAIGGFAGSTAMMAGYQGISRGVYAGDIGVGYDAIVQSESRSQTPHKQARLAIYALFSDTLICTISTMIIAVTGAWYNKAHMKVSDVIPSIINEYIPYGDYFMTFVLFFAGFTTIIAFLTIGIKSAKFISEKYGKIVYIIIAIPSYVLFSYLPQAEATSLMMSCAGLLVFCNIMSIIKLHRQIKY